MKLHLTQTITALCLLAGVSSTLNAIEPRMEKAKQLLQKAQSSSNPVPLLQRAQNHLQNATRNKGGQRVQAIRTVNQAISTAQGGGNVQAQTGLAIAQTQAGINARPAGQPAQMNPVISPRRVAPVFSPRPTASAYSVQTSPSRVTTGAAVWTPQTSLTTRTVTNTGVSATISAGNFQVQINRP